MHLQIYNILIKLPHIRYLNKNINSSLTKPTRNSGVLQQKYKIQIINQEEHKQYLKKKRKVLLK